MNQLFQGDNLTIIPDLPDASVDLICTDPPFNTGKDWGAFNDRWEGGLKGYLKFMEARVVEMRRVLKDTGSLYLHCDPTASHYLKVMLDGVFGMGNFRNDIIWCYNGGGYSKNNFPRKHDTILRYTLSDNFVFNTLYKPYGKHNKTGKRFSRKGQSKRGLYLRKEGTPITDWWTDCKPLINLHKERLGYPTQKPDCPLPTHDKGII